MRYTLHVHIRQYGIHSKYVGVVKVRIYKFFEKAIVVIVGVGFVGSILRVQVLENRRVAINYRFLMESILIKLKF